MERSSNQDFHLDIKEHMPVICSAGDQIAVVDHLDGTYIKLAKNDSPDGKHHWIPLDWVTRVDQHVHINRPGDRAKQEWLNEDPHGPNAHLARTESLSSQSGAHEMSNDPSPS